VGDGTINQTGDGQSVSATLSPGEQKTFFLRVRNAGQNSGDSFTVTEQCRFLPDFKCRYFYKGKNVTEKVEAENFDFKNQVVEADASTPKLRILVNFKQGASGSGTVEMPLSAESNNPIGSTDLVEMHITLGA
jgi:hypothetical protein